jgi:hypothetical protein
MTSVKFYRGPAQSRRPRVRWQRAAGALAGLGLGNDPNWRRLLAWLQQIEPASRIEAERPLVIGDFPGRQSFQPTPMLPAEFGHGLMQ